MEDLSLARLETETETETEADARSRESLNRVKLWSSYVSLHLNQESQTKY